MPANSNELRDMLKDSFTRELKELQELTEKRDQHLVETTESVIAEKTAGTQSLLEQMLLMQTEQDRRREERHKWTVRYVLVPIVLTVLGGGSAAGYYQTHTPNTKDVVDNVGSVGARVQEVELHLDRNDRKIERTVEILQDLQVQSADSTEYLSKKIEKAHPATRRVEVPKSVDVGRRTADKIKKKRGDTLGYDPADPLKDLAR